MKGDSAKEFAALKDLTFSNGTIAFDVKAIGEDMPGIRFRQRDANTAEEFYIRVEADCPAAQDCLQYTPVTHGRMLWDTYVQYQKPAPFVESQWNHIKLVISGRRMKVELNRAVAEAIILQLRIAFLDHQNALPGWVLLEGYIPLGLPSRCRHGNRGEFGGP